MCCIHIARLLLLSADCLLVMKEEKCSHTNYNLLFVFYVNVLNRAQNPAKMKAFQLTKCVRTIGYNM